ncbi:type 1 glutamine amidotransferase domain-containing protein [Aeromicrobium sp. Leaf350]|uniref:type 1 glutamine amidotransferase domain-containing protein n=1 Tax=Aeromicrobium sp. Leaf350 TaxID=2876565 RepID=UPI001E39C455|nr:type 1 glutamine amidotransferase domain-containing protein [Aeromicrobium sp. Leaf350]
MSNRAALLVLTSHSDLGGVRDTGYFVGEAAHPWKVFTDAGYTVDFASIKGGRPPEDGRDEDDPVQAEFLADEAVQKQLDATPRLSEISATDYDTVYFVGGHGTMWDFPDDPSVASVARTIYENDGVVAAVCHGPSALVGITLGSGRPLVTGKNVAAFTNAEEEAAGLTDAVPFLLQTRLEELGAHVQVGPNFHENVVVDGRLVTGQNPQSAAGVAREVVATLG